MISPGFGDSRTHENPGLMAMSLLWFRYHNNVAAKIAMLHPDWSDEDIFQNSRRTVIATFQVHTFNVDIIYKHLADDNVAI